MENLKSYGSFNAIYFIFSCITNWSGLSLLFMALKRQNRKVFSFDHCSYFWLAYELHDIEFLKVCCPFVHCMFIVFRERCAVWTFNWNAIEFSVHICTSCKANTYTHTHTSFVALLCVQYSLTHKWWKIQ